MSTLLNHPKGLYICFLTEMWERFSYYGMRGLLIFFLTEHFLFSDHVSYGIYGAYTALAYATPVIGGLIADRYLGFRKAVILGGIFLVLGHLGMAIEGAPATQVVDASGVLTVERDPFYIQTFYFSLALLIIGVGFLKPNISTIVGRLYEEGDPRRDSGFTIFYMGINLGAAAAALLCGYLGQTYGWAYGFGLAGIGMILGLIIFVRGQQHLDGHAEPPVPEQLTEKVAFGLSRETIIYISSCIAVFVAWQLVQQTDAVGGILAVFGGLVSLGVVIYSLLKCTPVERDRMLSAIVLILFSVVFWSFFEQAGSSMNLFADRNVDRMVLGFEIRASQFQSLNSIFIILMAPVFAILWIWLSRRGWEPGTPVKFALGIIQLSLGFGALVFGASVADENGVVAVLWLVLGYFLHTTGELCVSPVGLSMITKLSVARLVGLMMGVWFLSAASANFIASLIAKGSSVETVAGEIADKSASLAAYAATFEYIFWVSLAVGIVLLVISPLLRRGMHGIR